MSARFQAPRGTFDVLPADSAARARVFVAAANAFARAGYGRIETPVFEDTELFARGVGESTDIVQKEMFTFEDQGGRSLTLRPEATASICRAYVEHGMHKLPQPVKLWCWGPFFRHERPQAGRFRQFHQIDLEVIGTDSPLADAESIILLDDLLRELRRAGRRACASGAWARSRRASAYREELRSLSAARTRPRCRTTCARGSTRTRCAPSTPTTRGRSEVMTDAPTMLDRLDADDAEHFEAVKRAARRAPASRMSSTARLVRGLDYYTRTVFEFTSDALGAQSALGGGGRYDGLVAELGGPETPAVGWAAGIERILLALGETRTPGARRLHRRARGPARARARASRPRRGGRAPASTSTWPAARRRAR